jgi:hypothetical protein
MGRYTSDWRFLGASVLVAAVLVAVVALVVAASDALDAADAWPEVPRALLTLAVGVLVAGGVASLLAAHNRRVDERRSDHELRLQLVQQLRDAHNAVGKAALLIKAKRSARTYGQQVEEMLASRVRLLDVHWEVRARPRLCGGGDRVTRITALLERAARYIEAIVEEYGRHYDRVAAIQLASTRWNEARAQELAKLGRPPLPERTRTSTVPWTELTRAETFPRLADLLGDNDAHRSGFSEPIETSIGLIVAEDERR